MNDRRTRRLIWMLVAIVAFFVIAAVVQWIWNCIIPWVIGFPPVTYWQAAGLLLLTRILFGGLGRMFSGGCNCGCRCNTDTVTDNDNGMVFPGMDSINPFRGNPGPVADGAIIIEVDEKEIP